MDRDGPVRMRVGGLTLDPVTKAPIVILRDDENKRNLPIWIGLLEATAMATAIEGIAPPRPMTHDLLSKLISTFNAEVESVAITDLRENTYFAEIRLRVGGEHRLIDSRPSDAISLALRTKSPIYVARHVLESSGIDEPTAADTIDTDLSTISPDKWGEILDKMSPDDFKYKM